ncbi:hypothetical protein H4S02_006755 [Coemansia sp. RSA 2611]|nr:hypothetical protein H4S02_006755 [Coemansia sp. RSA 2611]
MASLRQFWSRWANRRPLLTLSLTNGVMGAIGDAIAQSIAPSPSPPLPQTDKAMLAGHDGRRPPYDFARTARFFVYGCMFGPVAYRWYSLLDCRFPLPPVSLASSTAGASNSAAKLLAIGKRVAVDQIVFAPVAIGAFFTVMGAMEGRCMDDIRASLRAKYSKALAGNYALWPWAQLVNFSVVPLIYRVPFASLVSVSWNVYLSRVNSRRTPTLDHTHG